VEFYTDNTVYDRSTVATNGFQACSLDSAFTGFVIRTPSTIAIKYFIVNISENNSFAMDRLSLYKEDQEDKFEVQHWGDDNGVAAWCLSTDANEPWLNNDDYEGIFEFYECYSCIQFDVEVSEEVSDGVSYPSSCNDLKATKFQKVSARSDGRCLLGPVESTTIDATTA
jgi:hypothetical protein